MMGSGSGGVWLSWLLWGGLVVLMVVGWVLLVNWAMQGNGGTVAGRPPAAPDGAAEDRPRRRDADGEVAPPANDQAAETASVPAELSAEMGTHGQCRLGSLAAQPHHGTGDPGARRDVAATAGYPVSPLAG